MPSKKQFAFNAKVSSTLRERHPAASANLDQRGTALGWWSNINYAWHTHADVNRTVDMLITCHNKLS